MCFLKKNESHCAAVLAALRSYHHRHGLAYTQTEPCSPNFAANRVTQFWQPGYYSRGAESKVDINFCKEDSSHQSWSKVSLSCEVQKGQKSAHSFPWFGGTEALQSKYGHDWQVEDLSPYPTSNSSTLIWFPQLRGGFHNWTKSIRNLNRAVGCAILIDNHIWFPWTHTDWLLSWMLTSALWLPLVMVTFVTCRGSYGYKHTL